MLNHSAEIIVPLLGLLGYLLLLGQVRQLWSVQGSGGRATKTGRQPLPGAKAAASCPGCVSDQSQPTPSSSERPPVLTSKRGRPRSVDTSSHYCPNQACQYYGWLGLGNIRANGHPNGSRWRQLECRVCGRTFLETINTIFYGKQVAAETIWQVLKALAEGLDIRATGRVFELDPNTVQSWLAQAGCHLEAVSHYLLHDLQLSQVQVDELWALLGHSEAETDTASQGRSKRWVWVGFDPVSKLMLAWVVGDRSLSCAQLLIHAIAGLLVPGCVPLFLSDQWSAYEAALLTHFGHWVQSPPRFRRGRKPQPRWQPLPDLQYAQVIKQRYKGRVVRVSYRVIYGSLERVQAILNQTGIGQVINTAFVERFNLTLRQHLPALGRKVISVAKTESGLKQQLSLGQAYYNFCLPHWALRLPLPEPQPTKGSGSPKQWQPRTPAMAAGLTDHCWQLEQLLLLRVPPWPQAAVSLS
jgi:IS1 family transposase/transposase-like protein